MNKSKSYPDEDDSVEAVDGLLGASEGDASESPEPVDPEPI